MKVVVTLLAVLLCLRTNSLKTVLNEGINQTLFNCTTNGYCPPLQWYNCNDTSVESLTLEFISYSHNPDPLIIGESSVNNKYAKNIGSKYVN